MNPSDGERVTYFGETNFRNQQTRFGIKNRDRTRHMYVVGKSGVGKSTLLENMAIQDIQNGEGVAVLDPHGSFAEKMLDYIPEHRIKDVVYFAPFDTDNPVSFNVLEDVGVEKRHLVVSGLMSTFKKIWVDAWSARMEYILSNTLLALLEYPGSTLLGVNRMLSDKDFRKKVVDNISDAAVKAFWTEEFAKYTERMAAEAVPAIQNKIGQLTANPLIRNVIGQAKSSFDVREIMDKKKILIVNLSKGRIGEQNTSLLGSMIITKIYLGVMSRADVSASRMGELPPFYFYVDEFQSFANETFANILSEARKYKLALIIAHQYVAQMEEPVREAVFGNVGTSISFRVGPLDAELLEKVYAPQFTATDLINLGMAQIYLSLMINDIGSPPFSAKTLAPIARPTISYRNDVIEWSRAQFAFPRATVEQNIKDWFALGSDTTPMSSDKPAYEKKSYTPPSSVERSRPVESRPAQTFAPRPAPRKEYTEFKKEVPAATMPVRAEQVPAKVHMPFKKVFENTKPLNTSNVTPSKDLINLLNSIDSENIPEKPKSQPVARPHFGDEKSLSETIAPVRLAERGPTESSRNLLKEALLKATTSNASVSAHGEISQATPKTHVPPQPSVQTVKEDTTTQEISHKDLQKILE